MSRSTRTITTSSRLVRPSRDDLLSSAREKRVADRLGSECQTTFERSRFFELLRSNEVTQALLRHIFLQYGHYRDQLHRWFALCLLNIPSSTRPDQKQMIMALADHLFTDLHDDHDGMFEELLRTLGVPTGTRRPPPSPATKAYSDSFLDEFAGKDDPEYIAPVSLAGRELVVAVRNQHLVQLYFEPRHLTVPTWIALHANLEIEHFLDALRPALMANPYDTDGFRTLTSACVRTMERHTEYLDALLAEAGAD